MYPFIGPALEGALAGFGQLQQVEINLALSG